MYIYIQEHITGIITAILIVSDIFFGVRREKKKTALEVKDGTIAALDQRITKLNEAIDELRDELLEVKNKNREIENKNIEIEANNIRLKRIIEAIQEALKKRRIILTINGDLITIADEDDAQPPAHRRTPPLARGSRAVKQKEEA